MADIRVKDLNEASVPGADYYLLTDSATDGVKKVKTTNVVVPVASGVSGLGTGVAAFLATPSSANLASALTDETGSGAAVFATSPILVTPTLGVAAATSINKVAVTAPAASATLTIADGATLTASASATVSGSNTGDQTITLTGDVTGTGAGSFAATIGATKVTSAMLNSDVFSTAHTWAGQQTFVDPILGTPASGTLTNATGLPISTGVSGLGTGVATALVVNVGSAGAPVVNGGALGTPASGVATNLTGTASGLTAGNVTTNANLTGDVTSVGNATTIGANKVTNAMRATMAAYTLKGNATGSTANEADIDVTALTSKASPVSSDIVLIQDSAASNAFKKTTVGALSSAGSVGSLYVNVKDAPYSAAGNGTTDDTAAIAAAIAATPSGGTLYLPPGSYKVAGSGSAIFTLTTPINILGVGSSANGGTGATILLAAGVPSTRDLFYISGLTNTTYRGYTFKNFNVGIASGSGGRHVFHFDSSAGTTTGFAEVMIDSVVMPAVVSAGGYSIFVNNGTGTNANGGTFNFTAQNNFVGAGIKFLKAGDSLRVLNNIITGANEGVLSDQISGAGGLLISGNNITASAGSVVIANGVAPIIENNVIEQIGTNTEANNAMVDLTGSVGTVNSAKIINNQIQSNPSAGNPTLLRIANASSAYFDGNRFATPSAYAPVVTTASAANTIVGAYNSFVGTGALSLAANTVAINLAGGQTPGTATNDNALAGYVGQYVSSSVAPGSPVLLTTGAAANVTSISLTAGDWDVWGNVGFVPQGATTMTSLAGWVSSTSATAPSAPNNGAEFSLNVTFPTGSSHLLPTGRMRLSLSTTTTVYLGAVAAFGAAGMGAYGFIGARRVR